MAEGVVEKKLVEWTPSHLGRTFSLLRPFFMSSLLHFFRICLHLNLTSQLSSMKIESNQDRNQNEQRFGDPTPLFIIKNTQNREYQEMHVSSDYKYLRTGIYTIFMTNNSAALSPKCTINAQWHARPWGSKYYNTNTKDWKGLVVCLFPEGIPTCWSCATQKKRQITMGEEQNPLNAVPQINLYAKHVSAVLQLSCMRYIQHSSKRVTSTQKLWSKGCTSRTLKNTFTAILRPDATPGSCAVKSRSG